MYKKIMLLALVGFVCFTISGCVVATYPIRAKRVDQSLTRGNRGYLFITDESKIPEGEPRKDTRQLQVIELRPWTMKDRAKPELPILVSKSEAEARPAVPVLEVSKESKERQVVSAPVSKPVERNIVFQGKKVVFGFAERVPTWEIPEWCFEKPEYVGKSLAISRKYAQEGETSLELIVDFPGKIWTAAHIDAQEYFDWTPYKTLSADIYLPSDAPFGLQAKLILTVGESWTWTEMARLVKLVPGEWTTITASIIPGSTDWRRTDVTDEFRADVRKVGIRIESNMRPTYSGPIYIDNVRVE